MQRDLDFISQLYESVELPKEKKYLLKYFDTPLQHAFIKYVHVFNDYDNFIDHTGLFCQIRWQRNLYNRLRVIEVMHKTIKKNAANSHEYMQILAKLESGNYEIAEFNALVLQNSR